MIVHRLREREPIVFLGSLMGVAGVTAALRALPDVSPTTAALALLVCVLMAATLTRLRTAIAVALLAMLPLNYFFLPPVGTFAIADPEHSIAWLAFLVVAIIASKLSAAARDRARAAMRADLAATVLTSLSHDLRTPLTAIRLAIENLREDMPDPQRALQARAALTELERLNHLFENILDMARIDAAAVDIERRWVTAADVVDASLAQVREAVDGRLVDVEADADSEVEIDPRLTSGALAHVIQNAVLYSPPHLPIEIRAAIDANGLRIAVRDHGPGLDPEELGRVFERFYRGRSGTRLAPGTGMGLSITRGLLAAAGGRIDAANAAGGGAAFDLRVPGRVRRVATAPAV